MVLALGALVALSGALGGCNRNDDPGIPPTAEFAASPSSGTVPLTVQFDASGSYAAGGGDIVGYQWDFDDGSTGTGQVTTHTYDTPGQYDVTLEVTDAWGRTASTEETISVHADNGGNGSVSSFQVTATYTPISPYVGGQRLQDATVSMEGKNLDAMDHREYYWRIEVEAEFIVEGVWSGEVWVVYAYNGHERALYLTMSGDFFHPEAENIWYKLDEDHDEALYREFVDAYGEGCDDVVEHVLEHGTAGYTETVTMDGEQYRMEVSDTMINDHIPDARFRPPPGARVEEGWPEDEDDWMGWVMQSR